MSMKLFTYPNNSRAWKALVAAKYAGVTIETPEFKIGTDNKTAEFKKKNPLQKVPVLETPEGCIFESNAIARYVARLGNLYGANNYEAGVIDQWIDFAANEIELPSSAWLFPIFGIVPVNQEATTRAKADIRKALVVLNDHLLTRTFLVGERVSLADIVVSMSLFNLYKMVLDPGFRKGFPNVTRWYLTCVNQPEFIAVVGSVELCQKMMVAKPAPVQTATTTTTTASPKKNKQKKQQADEEKTAKEEEAAAAPKKEKAQNPLELLPPTKFVLDEWKRMYSNNDTRDVALPWFWENYDAEGWSIWFCDYKYNDENTKLFMTNNLLGGFIQRLDKLRKYGFGSLLIFGAEPRMEIGGCFLFRGQDVPAEMSDTVDYPNYDWRKADPKDEKDKKLAEDYWAWNGEFGGTKPAFCDQGKVFK